MLRLQELLHKFEEGSGVRYLKIGLLVLAVVGVLLSYNLRCYSNMTTIEAMDAAQVGRNLAEGRGYSTLFIRPVSIYLVQKTSGKSAASLVKGTAQLEENHPDLANPPLYPVVLAGLLKVLHPSYENTGGKDSLWNQGKLFWWYGPDFFISLFNQVLFFVLMAMTFFLARRLFEPAVAWVTVLLMLGTQLFWRFAVSGLSTMLVMVIFAGLCWCLALIEATGRDPARRQMNATAMAAIAGLLLGLGGLTRYSFAWLLIPAVVFLILFSGPNRVLNVAAAIVACAVVMSPWIVRNVQVCGLPFGTATLAVMQESAPEFEGTKLDRSLTPDLSQADIYRFAGKFKMNIQSVLIEELPRFCGSWVGAFFLVGLMVAFISPGPGRLRYFLIGCLILFCLVESLGRTYLSSESPEINTENLLVLLAPMVLMYGVSLFYILVERLALPFRSMRLIVIGVFVAINSVPMIMGFLPPRGLPFVYPTYFPPVCQAVCNWMRPDELMMSDIPWCVAWYGQRQCIWLTLDADTEFYKIHDYQKQIHALYLTPKSIDSKFVTEWIDPGEKSWGGLILSTVIGKEVPRYFPLKRMPSGFTPRQIFLSDRQRW